MQKRSNENQLSSLADWRYKSNTSSDGLQGPGAGFVNVPQQADSSTIKHTDTRGRDKPRSGNEYKFHRCYLYPLTRGLTVEESTCRRTLPKIRFHGMAGYQRLNQSSRIPLWLLCCRDAGRCARIWLTRAISGVRTVRSRAARPRDDIGVPRRRPRCAVGW